MTSAESYDPATIACVWVGDKYSADYVLLLRDMIGRNTNPTRELRFVCITDRPAELPEGVEPIEPEPGLPGWFQKLAYFKPGKIPGDRIAAFDLDVAITGELDSLINQPGIIKDWNLPCWNSSVMVWDAGDHADVWAKVEALGPAEVCRRYPGDQDLITEVGGWDVFPDDWCRSYRKHCSVWPTSGCKVVCFHGLPKPHQVTDGWVPILWKAGGLTAVPLMKGLNIGKDGALDNARSAIVRDLPWFTGVPPDQPNNREAIIVAGGPSMRDHVRDIRKRHERGGCLISMNGSARWLMSKGMKPDCHIMLDGRPDNVQFVEGLPAKTKLFIASQCHPDVFDAVEGRPDVWMWHAAMNEDLEALVKEHSNDRLGVIVGGGSTVGLRALYLAFISGFRRLHAYGMDGSYHGAEHHAFAQPLNDGERTVTVMVLGKSYTCAPWMVRQANEFHSHYKSLVTSGARLWFHGRGLIPDMARAIQSEVAALEKQAA